MAEDLVTDTITNPMLQRDRKGEIARNLRWLHTDGAIYALITKYPVKMSDLLGFLSAHHPVSPEDIDQAERVMTRPESALGRQRSVWAGGLSTIFAAFALLITLASYLLSETTLRDFAKRINIHLPIVELLLGTLSSVIAALTMLMAFRLARLIRRRRDDRRISSRAEEDRG